LCGITCAHRADRFGQANVQCFAGFRAVGAGRHLLVVLPQAGSRCPRIVRGLGRESDLQRWLESTEGIYAGPQCVHSTALQEKAPAVSGPPRDPGRHGHKLAIWMVLRGRSIRTALGTTLTSTGVFPRISPSP